MTEIGPLQTPELGFQGAGQAEGLNIWRVSEFKVQSWPTSRYGEFYTGDSYICLSTKEVKGSLEWHIFFWLGSESTSDEIGTAAHYTVFLDDMLGGGPVQHREVQGCESNEFLALFRTDYGGVRYLEGGADTAFAKVDRDAFTVSLYHLKGKRDVRCQEIKRDPSLMNAGDVFILYAGLNLFQWNGTGANKYEKFAALQMMNRLKDEKQTQTPPELHFVDQDSGASEESLFWFELIRETLGDGATVESAAGAISAAKAAVQAELPDDLPQFKQAPPKLLRVSDESGSMEFGLEKEGELVKEDLDGNDVFIIDAGSVVYSWIGKGSNQDERNAALDFATQYLRQQLGAQAALPPVKTVKQHCEEPSFKSLFKMWDPPVLPSQFKKQYQAKEKQADFDVNLLYAKKQAEADESMVDDGTGELTIWRVEDFDLAEWPKERYGEFYAGDAYIVFYKYMVGTTPNYLLYFWLGRNCSADESGTAALKAKELDDQYDGAPVQVRVVQNKEPNHFLALFHGHFIVHYGGRGSGFKNADEADTYDDDGVSLFHVKGTNASNTRAVQVPEKAHSLNGGDCFVLLSPETMYIWYGMGALDDERSYAKSIAEFLKGSRNVVELDQGATGGDADQFFQILEGSPDQVQEVPADDELGSAREPRLFQASNKTGEFTMEEISAFTQDDLVQDDIFLLDTYNSLWVWVGHDSNREEREYAFKAALDYVQHAPDGRDKDTPVLQVAAGHEPPPFTQAFLGWDYGKAADFADPYAAALALASTGVKAITADDLGYRAYEPSLSLDQVLAKEDGLNLDPKNRELYLSDADFQAAMGCNKSEFAAYKGWKKDQLKKKAKLF